MKFLLFGASEFEEKLRKCGLEVDVVTDKVTAVPDGYDMGVVYRYRHIIPPGVIEDFDGKLVNLHISLLPWNRGADPNIWSFLESTPRGVTIHRVDEGLDTGPVIMQKAMHFGPTMTLRETYNQLNETVQRLFLQNWEHIYCGFFPMRDQEWTGTYHRSKDKEPYLHLLTNGWDTRVELLEGMAL